MAAVADAIPDLGDSWQAGGRAGQASGFALPRAGLVLLEPGCD
jgi:hypothetical protein